MLLLLLVPLEEVVVVVGGATKPTCLGEGGVQYTTYVDVRGGGGGRRRQRQTGWGISIAARVRRGKQA